jgi:hypothetical protein
MASIVHAPLFWLLLLLAADKWPASAAGNDDVIVTPRGAVTQIRSAEIVTKFTQYVNTKIKDLKPRGLLVNEIL